jgi:hypothetical protein
MGRLLFSPYTSEQVKAADHASNYSLSNTSSICVLHGY